MQGIRRIFATAIVTLSLAACGGSSGGSTTPPPPPPPPPPTVTMDEAFQFLNQATFGATQTEVQHVVDIGIEAWIDEQMQMPVSRQLPHLQSLPRPQNLAELQVDRVDIWFRNAINQPDQLRQRVAFALSEITVVSQLGALVDAPYSLGSYYDVLAENAFGNYRQLVQRVTLHPAMGVYLSMLGNEKPNPALNIRPDENYARARFLTARTSRYRLTTRRSSRVLRTSTQAGITRVRRVFSRHAGTTQIKLFRCNSILLFTMMAPRCCLTALRCRPGRTVTRI